MYTPSSLQATIDLRSPIVYIVDDDVSVRESLALLSRHAGMQARTFASANEFLAFPRIDAPSCLVLDVSLPDVNGLDLQARIATDRSDMPVIVITGYRDVPMTVRAMKAGAAEFMTKPLDAEEMLSAVRSAIERSRLALEEAALLRELRSMYASLSHRERQVLSLVVAGRLNKQIARELGISEITVKAHRGKVMRKMQADSLAQLVKVATRLRLESGLSIVQRQATLAGAHPLLQSVPVRAAAVAVGGGWR